MAEKLNKSVKNKEIQERDQKIAELEAKLEKAIERVEQVKYAQKIEEEQSKLDAVKKDNKRLQEEKEKVLSQKEKRDRDHQKVKGRFDFFECPGGLLKFPFKKYHGDKSEIYEVVDGQIYELPLMVAKHLNHSGQRKEGRLMQDEDGKRSVRIGKIIRRYGFQSLDFVDVGESRSENRIVTVERS